MRSSVLILLGFSFYFWLVNCNYTSVNIRAENILLYILGQFQSLGYVNIEKKHLTDAIWKILGGDLNHFNTHCVKALLETKKGPDDIWTNEDGLSESPEQILYHIIFICKELEDWKRMCTSDDNFSLVDLINSDIHYAVMIIGEDKGISSNLPLEYFCEVAARLSKEPLYSYNSFCVNLLLKLHFPGKSGENILLDLSEIISICSATNLWSEICFSEHSDFIQSLPEELQLFVSAIYTQIKNSEESFSQSSQEAEDYQNVKPVDFCEIAVRMNNKVNIGSYFNTLCMIELTTPLKLSGSKLHWNPTPQQVINLCINNPLWESCPSLGYDEPPSLINIETPSSSKIVISTVDTRSLLSSAILKTVHTLPLTHFSSNFYQYANIKDICHISEKIQLESHDASKGTIPSDISPLTMGHYFNAICWRKLSTYPLVLKTKVGVIVQPLKSSESIFVCNSAVSFWYPYCDFEDINKGQHFISEVEVLAQELQIKSQDFYKLPHGSFCNIARQTITTLDSFGGLDGHMEMDENDSLSWILHNIPSTSSNYGVYASKVSNALFNRECVRELIGNRLQREEIPLNIAIEICGSSLRWKQCYDKGIFSKLVTEFVASEFYYAALAEEIYPKLNWNHFCLAAHEIVPEAYSTLNIIPNFPYFNHKCVEKFMDIQNNRLDLLYETLKESEQSQINNSPNLIKMCVHSYFWRKICNSDNFHVDLLANSLLYGSHQYEHMQGLSESIFCKAAYKLSSSNPLHFTGECMKVLMDIGSMISTEVAESACSASHRNLVCLGYSTEYTSIAQNLFSAILQFKKVESLAPFSEFCKVAYAISTDLELKESTAYFPAICAKYLKSRKFISSLIEASIACNRILTFETTCADHYVVELLASEFFKQSRNIESLKRWEYQYFCPVARKLWSMFTEKEVYLKRFNSFCVSTVRAVIASPTHKIRIDDAIDLCNGSIGFQIICPKINNPDIQHMASDLLIGVSSVMNLDFEDSESKEQICVITNNIHRNSISYIPIARDDIRQYVKYPYFLNACVEELLYGDIYDNDSKLKISAEKAASICLYYTRVSTICKEHNPLISTLAVGLHSEISLIPEYSTIKAEDLCNYAAFLFPHNTLTYLDVCKNSLNKIHEWIPAIKPRKHQITQYKKVKICSKPYIWPKCISKLELLRVIRNMQLEKIAIKFQSVLSDNNIDFWNFNKYCDMAEQIVKFGSANNFLNCKEQLEKLQVVDTILPKNRTTNEEKPQLIYFNISSNLITKMCLSHHLNSFCSNSYDPELAIYLANSFYSTSLKYLNVPSMKISDFCLPSELIIRKDTILDMMRVCPYAYMQVSNLEHWPSILLTPELAVTVCSEIQLWNFECLSKNLDTGITADLSDALKNIAIEIFFIRHKYCKLVTPEWNCNLATIFILLGVKNKFFSKYCPRLIFYDLVNCGDYPDKSSYIYEAKSSQYEFIYKLTNRKYKESSRNKEVEVLIRRSNEICAEIQEKLKVLYIKSHNGGKKITFKNRFISNYMYYKDTILRNFVDPIVPSSSRKGIGDKAYLKILKEREDRINLKKKLKIITKAKGFIELDDHLLESYQPKSVDEKLVKKYYANYPEDSLDSPLSGPLIYEAPQLDWQLLEKSIKRVSYNLLGFEFNVSDPKSGGLAELIYQWGYLPQGTIQGAQYIYRVARYINKFMINSKTAYILWKDILIDMNHSIIPKWRDIWDEEVKQLKPADNHPIPSCDSVSSSNILKQLGMNNKKISIQDSSRIDIFAAQLTEAAHELKISDVQFKDSCLVGLILFHMMQYSRTSSFNYQCVKWVKEIGYLNSKGNNLDRNLTSTSTSLVYHLTKGVRIGIPTEIARKMCSSTSRWMSCKVDIPIDEKLKIDMLATELLKLSRIQGLEFRDMCEVAIPVANAPDFNDRCPILLKSVLADYKRAVHICKSTSFWKSCPQSRNISDLKLREHLDNLSLELTLGLQEVYPDIFSFDEVCELSEKFVASEYFKQDCVKYVKEFIFINRISKPTLGVYIGDRSAGQIHMTAVAIALCCDTLRWQQVTCEVDEENKHLSLIERQWADVVSEEIYRELYERRKKNPIIGLYFKDKKRDELLSKYMEASKYERPEFSFIKLPSPIIYQDVCKQVFGITKTKYFNIDCIRIVGDIFQVKLSELKDQLSIPSNGEPLSPLNTNLLPGIPDINTIESICRGNQFWESCFNPNNPIELIEQTDITKDIMKVTDIVANDLVVSILQLSSHEVPIIDTGDLDYTSSTSYSIHKIAMDTLRSLRYTDLCNLSLLYARNILRYMSMKALVEYKLYIESTLAKNFAELILKKMFPNRRKEVDMGMDIYEGSLQEMNDLISFDRYMSRRVEQLPKVTPFIFTESYDYIYYLDNIEEVSFRYNISNLISKCKDDSKEIYHKSDYCTIYESDYLYIYPSKGLKLSSITPISPSYKENFESNCEKSDLNIKVGSNIMNKITDFQLLNPKKFHKAIKFKITRDIFADSGNLKNKQLVKSWIKEVEREFYYKQGLTIATEEWMEREEFEAQRKKVSDLKDYQESSDVQDDEIQSYTSSEPIKFEIPNKEKRIPSLFTVLFSQKARKERKEAIMFNKGLYRARLHYFLQKKRILERKKLRDEAEKSKKMIIDFKNNNITPKGPLVNRYVDITSLYSIQERSAATAISHLICYNQIASDMLESLDIPN
ncbi:uncharacterized protein CMU_040390 [Cryptosporidium muris RN66]|uniref:Clu domain-containing protein n=1 Tax=Cryptosporidium muris (strain RN66) TaxID=441375 RepID=B6A9S9_CRYMR|nr:uncharacterized protein CMU_040390 [Cryptosporidium muris RN66]EEA04970.1 hypothetical protein, conserved [Cryptosporidium muris RN66]|eukprot:XP_002139319.1 hypothetical protein [Cryptosporidium muris RN66]